ncbi:MAG: PaaI family thioesterase [Acidimicrobiia bacterium]|nr:PaaI family thioesterase [Acidimicrobiia bacterium]
MIPDNVHFPLGQFLGMDIARGEGRAVASVELGPAHMNPNGVAHGAVAFALMDTAMGAAVVSILDETQMCATVEIHTRYHRPATSGTIRAQAEVMTAGRRLVQLEAKTYDDDDRLIASATGSFTVFTVDPGA